MGRYSVTVSEQDPFLRQPFRMLHPARVFRERNLRLFLVCHVYEDVGLGHRDMGGLMEPGYHPIVQQCLYGCLENTKRVIYIGVRMNRGYGTSGVGQ